MKKILVVSLILGLGLLFVAGCKNPLFNPKADARISYFTDTANVQTSCLTLSGAAPHTIKAFVTIVNGIDIRFSDYTIDYYTTGGSKIPITVEGKTSAYIGGTGSTASTATGYVGLNITSTTVLTYKTTNSLPQLNLQILLNGEDINGNFVSLYGAFPIY
ncbi:MAG: hypothetical protein A2231_00615 [Candidatus Firestonebacteria bacterium RIFOXYA2_FULL_40_8]|nr:MAG: hypothetical protein A2231_00615 [Candidatus Firestonebacteria bacterium RIFOXYA2_FULL_40_8]